MQSEQSRTETAPPATWVRLATIALAVIGLVGCQPEAIGKSGHSAQEAVTPATDTPSAEEAEQEVEAPPSPVVLKLAPVPAGLYPPGAPLAIHAQGVALSTDVADYVGYIDNALLPDGAITVTPTTITVRPPAPLQDGMHGLLVYGRDANGDHFEFLTTLRTGQVKNQR